MKDENRDQQPLDGVVNLNKPEGITSAAAVNRVKRLLPRGTKIGHAGTLDPFASGILLLLVGKSTKLCERLMSMPKQYEGSVKFGANTATDDLESPEIPVINAPHPTLEQIDAASRKFIGNISQVPPAFSALKISGQPAYKLARRGITPQLEPRTVRIDSIEIIDWRWPRLKIRIICGRGTYIRAIARDLGQALGAGGYLTQLCRTSIGPFDLSQAVTLEDLERDAVAKHLHAAIPAAG
jgi:tRNA pseudouridine55 synthase